MFLNISNHPKTKWTPDQLAAAERFPCEGNFVIDSPFPNVPPTATTEEVHQMALQFVAGLPHAAKCDAVMVQGEFSLTYELTRMLLALGWRVVVATSDRKVEEVDGKKIVTFQFVQFREIRN